MEAKVQKSLLGLPSWGLSLVIGVFTIILLIVIASLVGTIPGVKEEVSEGIGYIICAVVIVAACFFICKNNPSSVWYVPVLCNIGGIFSAFVEPTFWTTSMWIFICIGWILSLIGAIIGAIVGRNSIINRTIN
jgi:hypothetical protein